MRGAAGQGESARRRCNNAAVPEPTAKASLSPARKALLKLGLERDIDLALHLPLRYEDETRITRLADVRDGEVAQIDCTV